MNLMGSSKNLTYVVVLFVLLILLAVVYWVQPNLEELELAEAQLAQTNAQIQQLESQLNQQSSDPAVDRVRLANVLRQIPDTTRTDELMFDTRSLEVLSGFPFQNYFWMEDPPILVPVSNSQGRSAQVMLTPLNMNQTFQTTYNKLYAYLNEIEDMTRVMRVRELTITAQNANPIQVGQTNRELSVNLMLETFYAPDLKTWIVEAEPSQTVKPFKIKNQPFE